MSIENGVESLAGARSSTSVINEEPEWFRTAVFYEVLVRSFMDADGNGTGDFRGLIEKPARIDTPVGTLADIGMYFTPRLSRRVLHQVYLGYPDSAAARGISETPTRVPRRPRHLGRPAPPLRVPGPVKRAVRLVPGVHW